MVIDMVTGEVWTPDTDTVRAFYNLGRYMNDTQNEARPAETSQGERESEFNRWAAQGEAAKALLAKLVARSEEVLTTDDYDRFADDVLAELEAWASQWLIG